MTQKTTATTASADPSPKVPTLAARMIENVEVELDTIVGQARMTVAELGALRTDAVVALDAPLNRAVELHLNRVVIARGELVAVGDRFGVRLTEIAE